MRIALYALSLISAAHLAGCAPEPDSATVQENQNKLIVETEAFLTDFGEALMAREFEKLEPMLAEDFRYQEPGSPVLSKDQLLERERRGAAGGPVSTLEYKVIDAKEIEGPIVADVELTFETRLPEGEETILFSGEISQEVQMRRAGDVLQFVSVEVTEQQLFRNGEPVGTEAIEEMHAGPS